MYNNNESQWTCENVRKKKLFIGNKQKQKFQFISESDEFVSLSKAMGDLVMTWCVCAKERECICCDEQMTIITTYSIFHMQQYSFAISLVANARAFGFVRTNSNTSHTMWQIWESSSFWSFSLMWFEWVVSVSHTRVLLIAHKFDVLRCSLWQIQSHRHSALNCIFRIVRRTPQFFAPESRSKSEFLVDFRDNFYIEKIHALKTIDVHVMCACGRNECQTDRKITSYGDKGPEITEWK